jgi:hypothetical protein
LSRKKFKTLSNFQEPKIKFEKRNTGFGKLGFRFIKRDSGIQNHRSGLYKHKPGFEKHGLGFENLKAGSYKLASGLSKPKARSSNHSPSFLHPIAGFSKRA